MGIQLLSYFLTDYLKLLVLSLITNQEIYEFV